MAEPVVVVCAVDGAHAPVGAPPTTVRFTAPVVNVFVVEAAAAARAAVPAAETGAVEPEVDDADAAAAQFPASFTVGCATAAAHPSAPVVAAAVVHEDDEVVPVVGAAVAGTDPTTSTTPDPAAARATRQERSALRRVAEATTTLTGGLHVHDHDGPRKRAPHEAHLGPVHAACRDDTPQRD